MTLVIYALYVHVYDLYQTSTALKQIKTSDVNNLHLDAW